jgi:hypothetical protein
LVEGQWKMLIDFAMVIRVTFVPGTWQNKHFLMSLFPTIFTIDILGRNVALTSFVDRIVTILTRR